jgi:two-component system chemotaxis response regulator CheB
MSMKPISVVVVDDSALIRSVLSAIINATPDMRVVATAPNPLVARERIRELDPDVITLDIEMPQMNGLDFLERLMALKPTPVVMISSLTERGGELTLRALELGAVDFVTKPQFSIEQGMNEYAEMIVTKLRAAASARVRQRQRSASLPVPMQEPSATGVATMRRPMLSTEKLIAVGASTGGTEAIRDFLLGLPFDAPGVVIVQHMPERFTRTFAARLDRETPLTVCEAEEGQRVLPGHAYIAPGNAHLLLKRNGAQYVTALSSQPLCNGHRPSVDVLFHSVAQHAGANAIGVILTGMGRDGAAGLLAMRQAGAETYAQDEKTCVVFGMPREAIAIGAAAEVLPIDRIAPQVMRRLART